MTGATKLVIALVVLVLVAAAAFAYLQFFRSSPQTVDATLLPQVAQPGTPDTRSGGSRNRGSRSSNRSGLGTYAGSVSSVDGG